MGAEQSNSSLVLDERYALKFYRRIAPGMNPELEVLRFLTERGFEHTPALEGYIAYEGRPLEATLAIVQEFVPSKGDGWELTRDSLVRGEPDWLPEHARRLGEVTAFLHNALASDPADPHFAPEEPSTEALGLLSASIDEEIEHVFTSLPEIAALEHVRGRGEEVRDHLRLLTNIGNVGRVIRTHGDYHLGQALWTDEGDWLVLDFEGEPARSVPERRRKTSPLRDVAGMLRSFAYAASAAKIRRNVDPPDDWEDRCRTEFLDGYLEAADPALLPSEPRPGRAAADGVRAREGRLRAPVRAPQPARLGRDPGRGDPPHAGAVMSLGELDLHLAGEGRHERIYERLGAHVTEEGVSFAVWAPNARAVSVVGDWNLWDGRAQPLEPQDSSGIWAAVVPDASEGDAYKFEVHGADGQLRLKSDPFAFHAEVPPKTASRIYRSRYEWADDGWLERRRGFDQLKEPISIYEVHAESWRLGLGWKELAEQLVAYAGDLGFTHVEFLPVMHHPFSGSWGYQVTGFYAPVSTMGEPDDFRALVDALHQAGIGVILDWVPAHFPRDEFALARFDGTALYEHEDPRRGSHPDWGTLIFNLGRNEVRNFLLANALYWLREYHADGLRVDAVASMLYLDYSRKDGEWVPNAHGGREDLEAVSFLRELNEVVYGREPGVMTIAEESTAWPGVSRPTYLGGLGFGFKWNMGWMHDTLEYVSKEPVHRRFHHHELTFSMVYAWNENFVLPLSHDEVVHGKGSLLGKMPGDRWQRFANLRALYGVHVVASRQAAPLHGRASSRRRRSGASRRGRSTGICSTRPTTRGCWRSCATSTPSTPRSPRSGSSTTRTRASSGWSRTRRTRTCSPSRGGARTASAGSSSPATSRPSCARGGGSGCRRPASGARR